MIRRRFPHIAPALRRPTQEPVVPMINVVFLLLIFFLMTAQIAPPDPFDVTLPEAPGAQAGGEQPLYLSAQGDIAYGALRGPAAMRAAANAGPVRLHADASLEAATLARTLSQLGSLGATEVTLITTGGRP